MDAPAELAAFCRTQWPRLVGTLHLYCGDLGLAEELAQDALERTCRRWDRVRRMNAPGPWVHRVAINLANSRFRRRSAARRAVARFGDEAPPDPDPGGTAAERVALRDAVVTLPERQRTALLLRFYADLDPDEVGQVMGCSGQAVRNLTHRAVASLRATLGELPEEVADGR